MRIAQLLPYDVNYHGGVREVVFHLSRELERRSHETTVIAPASGSRIRTRSPRLTAIATQPIVLPVNGSIARVIGLDPVAWGDLIDVVRDGSFDVVHLHEPILWLPVLFARHEPTATAYVGTFHAAGDPGEVGNVADLAGPVLSSLLTHFDRIGEARGFRGWRSLAQSATARLGPRISLGDSFNGVMELSRPLLMSLLGRLDAAIAVSRTAQAFASSYGVKPGQIIPNGVDVTAFESAARTLPALPNDRPTVLFFSRLDERKGLDTLIAAMPEVAQRVPSVRLIVAGNFVPSDGPAVRYRALAARLGVDVTFEPSPSETRKIELFRSSTLLCAPALGQESFGIILAEALAAGLPIVASDLAAFRDVLDGGNLGLLAPPGDVQTLADVVGTMLEDGALRERLSTAGQVKARDYAWEVVAERTLDVYRQLLTGPRLRSASSRPQQPDPQRRDASDEEGAAGRHEPDQRARRGSRRIQDR
jgi:phosphatidylinositol alpha-mannosyltransferase